MTDFDLTPRATPGASATRTGSLLRMEIPVGPRGTYRLAQFDDYSRRPRRSFPHAPTLTLRQGFDRLSPAAQGIAVSLRARVSADMLPGTWGFGLWNDPFGLSLGFGGTPFRLPTLPNAAWFFYGSPENHLSLRGGSSSSERSEERIETRQSNPLAGREIASPASVSIRREEHRLLDHRPSRNDTPTSGFFAGTFASPHIPSLLLAPALLAVPLLAIRPLARLLRKLAGSIIRQDGAPVRVDVTGWHDYKIEWQSRLCRFYVDDAILLDTPLAPTGPLGLVIWLDNQYAAWGPDGRPGYGTLSNPAAWMEVEGLSFS